MKHCLRMFRLQASGHTNLPKIVFQLRLRYHTEKLYHARKKFPSHK